MASRSVGKRSPWIWSLAAIVSCGFSRAQTQHFCCFQCWTCSARERSTIQPAVATSLVRPGIPSVRVHLLEDRSPLTPLEELSPWLFVVFSLFYLNELVGLPLISALLFAL